MKTPKKGILKKVSSAKVNKHTPLVEQHYSLGSSAKGKKQGTTISFSEYPPQVRQIPARPKEASQTERR
jgi:hypothetical protein